MTLKKKTALNNMLYKTDNLTVEELVNVTLFCASIPRKNLADTLQSFKKNYKADLPKVGHSLIIEEEKIHVLRVAHDYIFLLCSETDFPTLSSMPLQFTNNFYITDQTDSFAYIKGKGDAILERLKYMCRLDMDVFPIGGITRTLMAHQGHYILRNAISDFTFLTPRSSCNDFPLLHDLKM